ncbi:MAG: DUF4386 family protein [Paludibacter sp.]|nr:DUF4386 family protein [Paludibacter sp.]
MYTERDAQHIMTAGAFAALTIVLIIPVQIVIFSMYPPPDSVEGFFNLFAHSKWLGLLSLDLLYYINNALLALLYLALFVALRKVNYSAMLIALMLGLIGIAVYYCSAVGFEMMALSKDFQQNNSVETSQQILSAGRAVLARYKGSVFDVYYVLNAVALIIISLVMFKPTRFGRAAAVWGLIAGIFMIIPSTAGTIGLVFSLISLIPWAVFSVIIGIKMLRPETSI